MMTVPRLLEITQAWRVVPPLHRAFAGFIGALGKGGSGRSSAPAGRTPPTADENPNLIADMVAMGFPIDPKLLTP